MILIGLNFLVILFGLYKENLAQETIDNEHVYFKLQQESNPFDIPLENYRELYSQLCDNPEFDYYECYSQYLELLPESQCFYDYENESLRESCDAALCIQISKNLQNINDWKCFTGRLLDAKDFQYDGDIIPVVLGYEYRNLFQTGSRFSAMYLYSTYTFEVVGILEKDSRIYNMFSNICLDKYIVMPSFNILQMSQELEGISIHYANKTSGLLVASKNNFADVSNYIKQLLFDAECGDYSIDVSPVKYIIAEKIGIGIEKLIVCLFVLFLIFHIFYYKHVKKAEWYITNNRILFMCSEFAGSCLIFLILYQTFLYSVLLKTDIRAFAALGIFIAVSKYIYLPAKNAETVHRPTL